MKIKWVVFVICLLLAGCNFFKDNTSIKEPSVRITEQASTDKTEDVLKDKADLSNENMQDIFVLGKVWGYLKYYHPNVTEDKLDWDAELFNVLPNVLQSKNPSERDSILTDWIVSLGTYELENNIANLENEIKIEPDLDWIYNSGLNEHLVKHLSNLKNAKRTGENLSVSLVDGVGNPEFNEKPYPNLRFPNVEYQLLSLFRYWNIIEYYFPYKYLIEEDWDNVLKEFIPKFINAKNEQEYKLTTLEIIARIQDSHANIWGQEPVIEEYWGKNHSPLSLSFVEQKAVVTGYYNDELGGKTGIEIGDVITKINNQSVEDIITEKKRFIPASNYSAQLRDLAPKLLRSNEKVLNIEFVRYGKTHSKEIELYSAPRVGVNGYNVYQIDKAHFQLLESNIGYIYPGNIKNEFIPEIAEKIKGTSGLIIDLRCYPKEFIVYTLGELLVPESTGFTKFSNGSIINPGLFYMKETIEVGRENKDYYKGKVIILVNELTQSQAEFTAMAFRTAPNATVIGSTTAGADGNVSFLTLPGGIRTAITGIGIYYPDGTETQRVGIIPDITVTPTIEGIKENRDEILEKAIEFINSN
ncbi:peptidase S41 [Cytobacillus suaedae]|nr:peptidase S41 [Cytobacillus suaedae]